VPMQFASILSLTQPSLKWYVPRLYGKPESGQISEKCLRNAVIRNLTSSVRQRDFNGPESSRFGEQTTVEQANAKKKPMIHGTGDLPRVNGGAYKTM
jgi:hypothetical protein